MPNPFNPAPGAVPARIVGRDIELAAAREAVRRAELRQPPTPIVLIGQRGMGKTVLLGALRQLGERRTLAVAIESLPGRSLAERLRDKVGGLLASVEPLPNRAGTILRRALSAIPKLSYELPNEAGAIALGRSDSPEEQRHDHDSLITMLTALSDAARVAKRYVTITIDEVQDADLRSMQTVVAFVHESAQGANPILFGAAGLSETRDLIDKLRTYVQRWDTFDLRFLTLAETIEAIREPIVDEGASIDEEALYLLATESGGYPFFVQTYANSAWIAHRGDRITLADVERSLPEVRQRNEMNFYVRPLARLTKRELALALVLAELGPGSHSFGDVARKLGREARDLSSARANLIKKEIISSPLPGTIAFRVPFMDRFLRDHADDYTDEEVKAALRDLAKPQAAKSPDSRQ